MSDFETIWEERFLNLIDDVSTYYRRHGSSTIAQWMKDSILSFKSNANEKISSAASKCLRQLDVLHIIVSKNDQPSPQPTPTIVPSKPTSPRPLTKKHEELDLLIKSLYQSCNDYNKKHIDLNVSLLKKFDVTLNLLKDIQAVERLRSLKKQTTDVPLQQQVQTIINTWKEKCQKQAIKNKEELHKNLSKLSKDKVPQATIIDRLPTTSTKSKGIKSTRTIPVSVLQPQSKTNNSKPINQNSIPTKIPSKHVVPNSRKRPIVDVDSLFADDDDDGFIVDDEDDLGYNTEYQREINKFKRRFGVRDHYDDDDDDRQMESSVKDIENEDRRSRYIGKKEDEEELRKIQEEERREAMRKKKS